MDGDLTQHECFEAGKRVPLFSRSESVLVAAVLDLKTLGGQGSAF
jgi:hypothetical protein